MGNIVTKNGVPAMRVTQKSVFSTTNIAGGSSASAGSQAQPAKEVANTDVNTFTHKGIDYVCWGDNNRFPDDAVALIHRTSVLQTALDYKTSCCVTQGVIPTMLEGWDENLKDICKPLNNPDIISYLLDDHFLRYRFAAFRDINKFGNCFPLLIPNNAGNKIVRIDCINARHCRLSVDKTKLLVYAAFADRNPSDDETDCYVYDVLDETDPQLSLDVLKSKGKLEFPIAYPRIRNHLSNDDYYARADWWAAYKSGWLEIAHQIPQFLKKAYENAMMIKWHIKVPQAYYDTWFPENDLEPPAERLNKIIKWQNDIDKYLTSVDNAGKAVFTTYTLNESGKAEEKIEFEALNNKMNIDEKLSTSAAANSEMLFSLMVNPSVMGAGMPGGSPYAGSAGSGSDIREGFMISLILNYIEKQQVMSPVKLMFRFNGHKNIDFKYKNLLLTTLDKGKSTEEKIQ